MAHCAPSVDAALHPGCVLLLLSRAGAVRPGPFRQRRPRPSALPPAAGPLHAGSAGSSLPGLPVEKASDDSGFWGGESPTGLWLLPSAGSLQWPDSLPHEKESSHETLEGTEVALNSPTSFRSLFLDLNTEKIKKLQMSRSRGIRMLVVQISDWNIAEDIGQEVCWSYIYRWYIC